MDILELLTRSGTYVLTVMVVILTFAVRRVVELIWPSLKKQADANSPDVTYLTLASRWWNEVGLYLIPVVFGSLTALVQSDFLFSGIDGGARWMYGAVVGWFSSFSYKMLKKAIAGKLNLPETAVSGRPSVP